MNNVFLNNDLQEEFNKNGFVVIPFLDNNAIQELNTLYKSEFPKEPESFYSTSFIKDNNRKKILNEKVENIVKKDILKTFFDFKKLGNSFLSKPIGEKGKMPVHQDWTVVDENKFASITVWIPLIDTTENNGAIKILPKSHKFNSALRSPTIEPNITEVSPEILKRMQTLEMKAGEAFIFNHALFHASSINNSTQERVALTYGLVHKDAEMCFYHNNGENEIDKYAVDEHFFQNYNSTIGEKPKKYKIIESFKYKVPIFNKLNLIENINKFNAMKTLFKDQKTEAFFQKNGFVKLKGIDSATVKELKDYYTSLNLKDELGHGFHISMDQKDKTLVKQTMDKIYGIVLPKVEHLFENAKAHTCSFVVKEPHPQGIVPAHQDWTFVEDETEHCSISFWIPLQDVNIDNGALGVIKGSHNFTDYKRPSPSPEVKNPLGDVMFSIFPYLDIIDMKAGEVLAFNNKTFHASPPNVSNETRLAVGMGFTQKEAKLRHYYLKPNGKQDTIIEYELEEDFFYKFDNVSISKLYNEGKELEGVKKLRELAYENPTFEADSLIEKIKANGNVMNVELVEKLSKLFNYNIDGSKKEDSKTEAEEIEQEEIEEKSFWEVYTPMNIMREIKFKITGC